jgi:hypothetical protein
VIFTLVAARPTFVYVVRCVVSPVLNTALRPLDLWFGWLVHFKVHYQISQSKMFWVILCAYLLIGFLQKLITSICSIQHGRNHTANNIYKCWTSCNKCKYLVLQYSVSNQKHNSCKIYLKILQVVSKGRKIYWLASGVIGYDSERGPHKDHLGKIGGAWVVPFQNCIR